jgi:hypothetical protein
MGRLVAVAAVALLAGGWSSTPAPHTVGGAGLSLRLPADWHGFAAPGQLQAADFHLGRRARGSPEVARVGRGRIHLIVWDYGRSVPYLAGNFVPVRPPLALRRRDLGGPLEGFSSRDVYAVRSVAMGGELLEIVADLGPRPLAAASFAKANRVLATLRVEPPRIVRAHNGSLGTDGVRLRLPRGWSGHIEIPADPNAAQFVMRVTVGGIRLVLIELAGGLGAHADLPIALTTRNIVHLRGLTIARRVFSSAGRSFDLSVVLPSVAALAQANRLLRGLAASPRPWVLESCDLTLRLPGTWRAAVNPRSGCYAVITLHGPRLRVTIVELRPRERATRHVLVRSGRRFEVEVQPRVGRGTAASVLASLRAKRRA